MSAPRDVKDEIRSHNDEIMRLVSAKGGDKRQYRKERRGDIRAVVEEIYSPPRVTKAAKLLPELGIIRGGP